MFTIYKESLKGISKIYHCTSLISFQKKTIKHYFQTIFGSS